MIKKIKLIRNVTQFESVSAGATLDLKKLTLVYAENGRGKTSLAAILRSAGTGVPDPIIERARLGASNPPHIVIECEDGIKQFQNGNWNTTCQNIFVFDDTFVHENVFSGLSVDASHRQNLHELIIGAKGVALNSQLKQSVDRIEEHNKTIRALTSSMTQTVRGDLTVDDFCDLPPHPDVEGAIIDTKKALEAAQKQDRIRSTATLPILEVVDIDSDGLESLLKSDLPTLESSTVEKLRAHFKSRGSHGEGWIAQGMQNLGSECPFCLQPLGNSTIIDHYQAFFGKEYSNLQTLIQNFRKSFDRFHGGEARAAFERSLRFLKDRHVFWLEFIDGVSIDVDKLDAAKVWRHMFDLISMSLNQKATDPLSRVNLSSETVQAIKAFQNLRAAIESLNKLIEDENLKIEVVKERADAANISALRADLAKLNATRERYKSQMLTSCADYIKEKSAKLATETQRDVARNALNQYQVNIFPAFNFAINSYLQKFNAGFRLKNMGSSNSRGGTSCTYEVEIYATSISIDGSKQKSPQPSFSNTLSAGDRNTLALAFYFTSLDQHSDVKNCIAVIDDPMTSLDDHRTLTTAQEIRRLSSRVNQVIVLSHTKPFLCKIWKNSESLNTAAIAIVRENSGSTISAWDVNQDEITEYDRQHAMLRSFAASTSGFEPRDVARSIRPVLEGFLRVAAPQHFPPGTLLGPFRNLCRQKISSVDEILNSAELDELDDISEFANKFHHDTNPAWETESINDGEMLGYVRRTLTFVSFK